MPWCPVCKNEYVEGKTHCPDCDADLVDELPEEPQEESCPLPDPDPEELRELAGRQAAAARMNTHTSAKSRYSEMKSSAWTFLILGSLGSIFMLLALLRIIPLPLAPFAMLILLGMFLFFLVISLLSFRSAGRISADIAKEADVEARVEEWAAAHLNAEELSSGLEADTSEEMKYFTISEIIRERLMTEFPELDDAYAEELTEVYYNRLFS